MEWTEVVDFLTSRLTGRLTLEDVRDISGTLQVVPPQNQLKRGSESVVFKEVLNTYYYYKSSGQNGRAIETMLDKMSRLKRFEGIAAELKATYLTNLRIKQQIHITPFKKFEPEQVLGKKSSISCSPNDESSEISLLRNEIAELRQRINESPFNGYGKVPSSPKPPMRRKASSTPEKSPVSSSTDASRLDQMNKILLDHEVCISEQKKAMAKMSKLCFGALSAVEKIEDKISGMSHSESESNMISLWENSHKQLKKEIIQTKTEIRSIAERVKQGSSTNLGNKSNDDVKLLRAQTNLLSDKILSAGQNVEGIKIQLSNMQEQLNDCTLTLQKSSSMETEMRLKSSTEKNKEDIVKLELSLGRLVSGDIASLLSKMKDIEVNMGKRVSNAEHVVRIDSLRKDYTKKYESLKSDLIKELKCCENLFEKEIKVLSDTIQDSTSNSLDKKRIEGFMETSKKKSEELMNNMNMFVGENEDNKKSISVLNEKSSALEEEVKKLSGLMSKKLIELDNLRKQVDKKLEKRHVDELKSKIENALEEINECKLSRDQMSLDFEELKCNYSENDLRRSVNMTKLEECLDGSLQRQENIESELSSCKKEIVDEVKSNIEACVNELKEEIGNCKTQMDTCKSEMLFLGKDIKEQMEGDKLEMGKLIEPVNHEMKAVKQDVDSCLQDVAKCSTKLEKFNKDYSLSLLRVKDSASALEKKLSKDFGDSLQTTSQRLQTLIENLKECTDLKMQDHKKEIETNNASIFNTFVSKEELKDIEDTLSNDLTSVSEQMNGMKTDFEDLKLSEKSKYTLLDKKIKDVSNFSEEINSSVYKVDEELKDLRLDVKVESNSINQLKDQIDDFTKSQVQLNSLTKEVESCSGVNSELKESIENISGSVKKINDDFLQFKSFMQSSSNEIKTLEKNSNNDILCVKRKIDDLITSKNLREKLINNVERMDEKLEEFEKKINKKFDENIDSLEDDIKTTRDKLSSSEKTIVELDKRLESILVSEVKSRESIGPMIHEMKGAVESNLADVISHVMKNQTIIGTIMEMIDDIQEEEEEEAP